MQKAEYDAYLRSDIWRAKRQAALEAALHACQLCNRKKNLHVHHRTYERVGGDELLADLTVLCCDCHKLFHRTRSVKGTGRRSSTSQLKPQSSKHTPAVAVFLLGEPPSPDGHALGDIAKAARLSRPDARRACEALAKDGTLVQKSKNLWWVASDEALGKIASRGIDRVARAVAAG